MEKKLPCYFGFYKKDAPLSEMLGSLTQKYADEKKLAYTVGVFDNDSNEKHLVLAIPSVYNLNLVTSTGFQVPIDGPIPDTSLVINGEVIHYNIYYSSSRINPGPMNIVCNLSL